jgi:S1-C subfamily serine protease
VIGDVVTEVDGEAVASPDDVIKVVNQKQPDETMTLTVVTPEDGEPREVEVEVVSQPDGA